jgi:hypothetical protein
MKPIKIGDKIKNTITGQTQIAKTIKHGYINGYRSDLWVIVGSDATPSFDSGVKQINRALSGRMSDSEQENFEMKLFGTL